MLAFFAQISAAEATIAASLVAGLFGGVVGNIVKSRLDERSGLRRLRLERELARQDRVLSAQATLLDELTESSWRWRYTAARMTHEIGSLGDEERAASVALYRAQRWTDLSSLRALASQARRLISEAAYTQVREFYRSAVEIDRSIVAALAEPNRIVSDVALAEINVSVIGAHSDAIDNLLLLVGRDIGLAVGAYRSGGEHVRQAHLL